MQDLSSTITTSPYLTLPCNQMIFELEVKIFKKMFKLIANRWVWGRCPWKWVVVPSEMQALSRACRYPWQPREQAPSHRETSGDSYQPLYSPRPSKREGRGRGTLLHKSNISSSKQLHDLWGEWICVIWSSAKTHLSNRGAWSTIITDQHWLNFNLA